MLSSNGIIFVKDNICHDKSITELLFDNTELVRNEFFIRWLFAQAGLRQISSDFQTGFPKDWFRIKMMLFVIDTRRNDVRLRELKILQKKISHLYWKKKKK